MKETHKKLYGFLGLGLVAAMTFCAAVMPGPDTHAADSTVTDIVTVRVVGAVPDVIVDGITNNEVRFAPETNFTVEYHNSEFVKITLTYTDLDGNETQYPIDDIFADYADGSKDYSINALDFIDVSSTGDGFGSYTISVRGDGHEGAWDSEIVTFRYLPIYGEATENEDHNVVLNIESNTDETTVPPEDVAVKATVKIYNKETGEEVPFSPIDIDLPLTEPILLPFADYDMPSGEYVFEITPYNEDGDVIGRPYTFTLYYDDGKVPPTPGGGSEVIPVPDTGGLFLGGNISGTDYLITGLIILAIVGVGGAIYIIKHDKKSTVKIRRRK